VSALPTLDLGRYMAPVPKGTNDRRKKNARYLALRRDGYRCSRCSSVTDLTLHHRIPKADGGRTVVDNLETLCVACHIAHHQAEREATAEEVFV
jgi:5-methylcytosine-specific restriction endonuclease McrA